MRRNAIIAHRGASKFAKQENTIEAFNIAIALKADYVEFDIRRTKDKVLVVFHDDAINGKLLTDITYSELSAEASKEDYTVPFLEDVLKLCSGKIKLDIELKEAGYEKEIISLVKRYFSYEEFMMKSFVDTAVYNIKRYDSNITAGLLLGRKEANIKRRINEYFPVRRLKMCKADFISPNHKLCSREFIRRMHLHKYKVYVWTVNGEKLIKKMILRHADGIITDLPDVAINLRNNML